MSTPRQITSLIKKTLNSVGIGNTVRTTLYTDGVRSTITFADLKSLPQDVSDNMTELFPLADVQISADGRSVQVFQPYAPGTTDIATVCEETRDEKEEIKREILEDLAAHGIHAEVSVVRVNDEWITDVDFEGGPYTTRNVVEILRCDQFNGSYKRGNVVRVVDGIVQVRQGAHTSDPMDIPNDTTIENLSAVQIRDRIKEQRDVYLADRGSGVRKVAGVTEIDGVPVTILFDSGDWIEVTKGKEWSRRYAAVSKPWTAAQMAHRARKVSQRVGSYSRDFEACMGIGIAGFLLLPYSDDGIRIKAKELGLISPDYFGGRNYPLTVDGLALRWLYSLPS